jgi:maltose alpha-D-glucosyltransferase/alpha-amylase
MRNRVVDVFAMLREQSDSLSETVRPLISNMESWEQTVLGKLRAVHRAPIDSQRIRIHGDYHLGQVIYTGKDFFIVDLEGDWSRPLTERRIKRTPLRDVAWMVRSFHYAVYVALERERERGHFATQHEAIAEGWVRFWFRAVSALFLRAYLDAIAPAALLPKNPEHLQILFDAFLLDRTIAELGHELSNRRDSAHIPLRGLRDLIEVSA